MRLIDVNTLKLKEFFGSAIPPYAILSHTWGDEEVTFQDWERIDVDKSIKRKAGYVKITGACRRAQADGLKYLWCDTNCIDKRSSAELSEAINSMFAWYYNSALCYAYLADVKSGELKLAQSRWFTRGWTLQELLAPCEVVLFDYRWSMLGNRGKLAAPLSDITKIHIGALKDRETIRDYSIAQRMSWASIRETTRSEDVAYCLLGIFDINMPLLYGEGVKAFNRLQRKIIKISNDQSILAWDSQPSDAHLLSSALAPSPAEFRFCGSIVASRDQQSAYPITNLGISMNIALIKTYVGRRVLVGLNCAEELRREAPHSKFSSGVQLCRRFRVWIPLCQLNHHVYLRAHHPSSKIFLENSYPILEQPIPTDLFLSLDTSQAHTVRPLKNEGNAEILHQHSSRSPSGVLVMVASGNTAPDRCILKEAYPLGDTVIIDMKCRGVGTSSHKLISSSGLSVIFSVFWDSNGLPQDWQSTTILDPSLNTSSSMTSQSEWSCLFDKSKHTASTRCCNNVVAMRSIHERLRKVFGKSLVANIMEGKTPIVNVDSKVLKDSFEQPQLIIEIIFREPPKFVYNA